LWVKVACVGCVCDRLFQRQNATVTTVIQDNSSFEETTGCNQRSRHQLTTDKHTRTAQYHHRYTSRASVNGLFSGTTRVSRYQKGGGDTQGHGQCHHSIDRREARVSCLVGGAFKLRAWRARGCEPITGVWGHRPPPSS